MVKSKKLSKFKNITHGFFNKFNHRSKSKKSFFLKQIHSNKLFFVDKNLKPKNNIKGDALVTNKKNFSIGVLTADCAPILILDKNNKMIAAIHAGWKGALKDIITLSKEEGHNIQPKYYWKHRSLNFCQHYLKIEKSKGFLFSPWLLDNDEVDDNEEDSFDDAEEHAFAESIPFSL